MKRRPTAAEVLEKIREAGARLRRLKEAAEEAKRQEMIAESARKENVATKKRVKDMTQEERRELYREYSRRQREKHKKRREELYSDSPDTMTKIRREQTKRYKLKHRNTKTCDRTWCMKHVNGHCVLAKCPITEKKIEKIN